jgi:phosphoserine phosphatase
MSFANQFPAISIDNRSLSGKLGNINQRRKKMLKRNSQSQIRWILALGIVLSLWSFQSFAQTVELKGNWNPQVKARLEALIAANANQEKVCVFDFDNTTLCRDIGEATMAAMNEAGKLTKKTCNKAIAPEFVLKGKKITLATSNNLMDYYEDFLSATSHHEMETTPYENGYGWVVQAMAPGTPADWLKYTKKAYAKGKSINDAKDPKLNETKINGYRVPFLYPEMVELYGVLLSNGYDVYVMSASNVHTVRYIVKNYLNPQIRKSFGEKLGVAPDHVLGVSLLMNDDRTGELVKDPYLVKENKKYADLDEKELSHYHLTNQICYPMTGYFGKLANIDIANSI